MCACVCLCVCCMRVCVCVLSVGHDYLSTTDIEQVLEATPHKAAAIRSPTTRRENYQSQTNQTCRTLLET